MITLQVSQDILEAGDNLSLDVLKQIESCLNNAFSGKQHGNIDVRFVSDNEIKKLNRMYRSLDEVTDVLSFGYPENIDLLGDIAISYAQAQRQAGDRSVEHEIIELIVHGVLHILGYDHEKPGDDKEMFSLQDAIIEKIL
ncbi:rRNA maturation RNase YbeY [Patescibacteria group bacterium]|nr:rRNA maturation RNase YbeY [Patescibacteria group bacterium]MBU4453423.1 rRNA maturation RNase YbeY [Patescibacteria group bacterium]